MKKYISIALLLLTGTFMFVSCNDGFLDEVATNQVVSGSYFQNYEQANTVLTGAYRSLQTIYKATRIPAGWGFHGTDEVTIPTYTTVRRTMHVYTLQSNNPEILDMWQSLYVGIYRANLVIDRVGAMTAPGQISVADQTRLIAEAKFLRGMFYFQLVKIFGAVPMTTSEIASEKDIPNTRTPVEQVYAQVIEDLKFAKANCGTKLVSGQANQGAATALLGRVYLQMTGWPLNQKDKAPLAAAELKAVIDNPLYGLATTYADIFDYNKENNADVLKEVLFTVKFDGPGKGLGGEYGSYTGQNGPLNDGGGLTTNYCNTSMVLKYDTARDVRFKTNIAIQNATTGVKVALTNWKPYKWRKPMKFEVGAGFVDFGYDTPIDYALIRFSDVLLMYAEAINVTSGPTQEALDAINKVRARGRVNKTDPLALPDIKLGVTPAQFVDILLLERYFELGFEGTRKDDLIRTDKLLTTVKALKDERWDTPALGRPGDIQEFHRYFPIPISEIQVSKIPQNPGY